MLIYDTESIQDVLLLYLNISDDGALSKCYNVSLLKSQMKATNTVQNLDPIEDEILQSFLWRGFHQN